MSVVIPAFNCAEYIAEALESVLQQRPRPLEVIVVDDGSTDDTAAVVHAFGQPVRYLRLPGSGNGAGAARNAGLRASRGEYIAFLDADDVWLPGKLEAQLRLMASRPQFRLCATQFRLWRPYSDGTWPSAAALVPDEAQAAGLGLDPERSGWLYHKLLMDTVVWTSTVVLHRGLVEQVGGFREDFKLGQDYDYWLRASRYTPIATLSTAYALYRKRPDSATARWAPINYELRALQSALARWGTTGPDGQRISEQQLQRRLASLHFRMGYNRFWAGAPAEAIAPFWHASRHRPAFWRSWAYLAAATAYSTGRALGRLRRPSP
ncbi:hypothetical protein CKO13_10045 [Halorhodospira neutriphila]|uniref:Glycosyltransferase 2-like domain-containing protein n=1 Tax=Halorhodospira neutriphila TaxID=168379 RepID=A0ABS1E6I8_9GAMM|nr:hypothetical protein [Halorhodospira neutriphila]